MTDDHKGSILVESQAWKSAIQNLKKKHLLNDSSEENPSQIEPSTSDSASEALSKRVVNASTPLPRFGIIIDNSYVNT